uniref:Uncharacterized protein n=1 Tax=Caenorhabditis japonica TaxID=281687 RepID=A0A8R1ET24_CAEJA
MVNTYCSRNRALLTVGVVVSFSIVYNVVRFWEYRIDFNADPRDLTTMVQPVLRGNPHFMLWYQNVATMSSQFVLPLVVLCVLNLQYGALRTRSLRTVVDVASLATKECRKLRKQWPMFCSDFSKPHSKCMRNSLFDWSELSAFYTEYR